MILVSIKLLSVIVWTEDMVISHSSQQLSCALSYLRGDHHLTTPQQTRPFHFH